MLRLFLFRHAKATPHVGGGDRERPLNQRGIGDARRIGAALASTGLRIDLALVSDARRTRETFTLAFEQPPAFRFEPRVYDATAATLLGLARGAPDDVQSLMIVGHNPGLAELAVALAGSGDEAAREAIAERFPTASLAIVEFACMRWVEIAPQAGRLIRLLAPEFLDAAPARL